MWSSCAVYVLPSWSILGWVKQIGIQAFMGIAADLYYVCVPEVMRMQRISPGIGSWA